MTRAATVLVVAAMIACGGARAPEHALDVVASTLPVYVFAENVVAGVEGVDLSLLVPAATGCAHDYALTTAQSAALEKADVVIMVGHGYESFVERHPALSREGVALVVASDGVDPLPARASQAREESHDDHRHAVVNQHFWASPRAAGAMVMNVAEGLSMVDARNAGAYRANAAAYIDTLNELADEFRAVISASPNPWIVTMHDAFDYLARDEGLVITDVIELEPGVEPSSRRFAGLVERVRAEKPAAIAAEPQYSARPAAALSRETGVPLIVLDPFGSGDTDRGAYVRAMRRNLETLREALR